MIYQVGDLLTLSSGTEHSQHLIFTYPEEEHEYVKHGTHFLVVEIKGADDILIINQNSKSLSLWGVEQLEERFNKL